MVSTHVLAGDCVDDIIRRCAQQLSDNGELVHMVLSREEGLPVQHLGEDAASAPDVHLDVVFLPCEHDLGGSVVSRRNVARHLRVLDTGQAKVANLQIAVFVDENVAWFQVPMDDTRRVDVFQASLPTISVQMNIVLADRKVHTMI